MFNFKQEDVNEFVSTLWMKYSSTNFDKQIDTDSIKMSLSYLGNIANGILKAHDSGKVPSLSQYITQNNDENSSSEKIGWSYLIESMDWHLEGNNAGIGVTMVSMSIEYYAIREGLYDFYCSDEFGINKYSIFDYISKQADIIFNCEKGFEFHDYDNYAIDEVLGIYNLKMDSLIEDYQRFS